MYGDYRMSYCVEYIHWRENSGERKVGYVFQIPPQLRAYLKFSSYFHEIHNISGVWRLNPRGELVGNDTDRFHSCWPHVLKCGTVTCTKGNWRALNPKSVYICAIRKASVVGRFRSPPVNHLLYSMVKYMGWWYKNWQCNPLHGNDNCVLNHLTFGSSSE